MKFKSYIKLPKWNTDQHSGFTLIELLVATIIMSIVMTLAGSAFVTILEQNRKAEAESQTRQNLNRALDYIANDIRRARQVNAGAATGEVFSLTIPGVAPAVTGTGFITTTTTTYSVANSTGVWRYYNDTNNSTKSIMRNGSFLVNNIQAPVAAEITRIRNACPNTIGTLIENNGFYACIYTGGNRVDLYLYGRLSDNRTPATLTDDEIMLVESTVYTRSRAF